MRSAPRAAFAARTLAILSLLYTSTAYAEPSANALDRRAVSRLGCYSSISGFTSAGTYLYQSSSYCAGKCPSSSVYGMSDGNACYCGNSLPPSNSKVDDSKCSMGCTGFPSDNCGGDGFYMLYATGNGVVGGSTDPTTSSDDSSSNTSGSSTSTGVQVVTSVQPGHTVVVTQPASTSSSSSSSGGGGGSSNTAGIAAGVVVGIVALGAIVGGVYFFLRRRRQQAIEEEHRQRTQVSDFMANGMERKTPGTSYSHHSDARLDPEAGRRNSVGSFMDDSQDYSRKILRVANPDH